MRERVYNMEKKDDVVNIPLQLYTCDLEAIKEKGETIETGQQIIDRYPDIFLWSDVDVLLSKVMRNLIINREYVETKPEYLRELSYEEIIIRTCNEYMNEHTEPDPDALTTREQVILKIKGVFKRAVKF